MAEQFGHLACALRAVADALDAAGAAIEVQARASQAVKSGSLANEINSDEAAIKRDLPQPQGRLYPMLSEEMRATVGTDAAAFHLNRREQTLRGWACHENGPLRPRRINGRLAWSVADLRRILGVSS